MRVAGATRSTASRIGATSVSMEKPGSQLSWWLDRTRLEQLDLAGDELG